MDFFNLKKSFHSELCHFGILVILFLLQLRCVFVIISRFIRFVVIHLMVHVEAFFTIELSNQSTFIATLMCGFECIIVNN